MAEDITVTLAVEIEICMVCEIDHSRSIRLGGEGETKLVLLCPLIARNCLHSARITLLAVLRIIHELYTALMLTAFPNLVLETLRTTMEMVRAIVYRKGVLHSVKSELSESDTIGITARNLTRARTIAEIACRFCISENDVSKITILVRHHDRHDAGTDA
jgi:hypothetical protein